MKAQQVLDVVIKPTLIEMQKVGNYNTINARMLLLATHAIESDLGLYNRQIKGPAVSPFQLEPSTIIDTARNWDKYPQMTEVVRKLSNIYDYGVTLVEECETNQRLACLIARGKYAMDSKRLPSFDDKRGLYDYYKRVYNTGEGASNWSKWCESWKKYNLDNVDL